MHAKLSRADASPLGNSSTAELLADRLRDAIVDGSIAPGAQLHQQNLAGQYGVSRSPIREALRLLEARGFVTYYPNRGAVVTSVGSAQIKETFELRRLIEPKLAELSAASISERELGELDSLLGRADAARDASAWNAAHREFHERIYRAADRPRMLEIVNDSRVPFSELADFAAVALELQTAFSASDHALLAGLLERNARTACTATLRHIDILEARVMQRFGTP